MKNIFKILYVTLFVVAFVGCEEYLDKPKPTDQLTSVDIYSSREGVEAYISGIYRRFRAQHAERTDVGGIYSMYFARTIKATDLIQKSSWYRFDYDNDNREPAWARPRETWVLLYDLVDHANTLITEVEKSTVLSEGDKKEFAAHGKALRAYFYFQLALEYQAAYPVDPEADAPPIYTEPTAEPKGMSTLKEMYTLILSDINTAITDLPEERLGKSYINKSVANGIKARVLMAMNQNWDQIETAAKAAYGDDLIAAVAGDYTDGFDDIENANWLWGLDQRDDQSNYYYAAPHAFTDHYVLSYAATFVNDDFAESFSATDVRSLFQQAYGVPDGDYRQYITSKFVFTFKSDIPTMRKAEMLLVAAEAMVRQNKPGGHELLFTLQQARDPQAVKSSNTGDDLIEEILFERRKELYGEMGVEWFDAKRLQRPLVRTGNHRIMKNLEVNDKRFFLKIPQIEIDSNPNIDASVNANR